MTAGTTPNTPRMRVRRFTGQGLSYTPTFVNSEERRSDGMQNDPINTGTDSKGPVNFEFHYPYPNSPLDCDIQSALRNTWTNTNSRDNDGTADSVITDVATTNTVVTMTTGTSFTAKALYRFTGFGVTLNNGIFACTTASATVPRFVGSGITNETVPPAAARIKEVGFIGDSGDINATASGLSSTTTDFTTFAGLAVGKWIKIGGTAAGTKFVTTALNAWVRVTAVTATTVTCDNLPSGWTTETGTAITLKVWYGDQIKNGTTQLSQTIERGFLGQASPVYIVQTGMTASQYTQDFTKKMPIKGTITYMGMSGSQSTSTLDASPDDAVSNATYPVMSASANIGRMGEAGSAVAAPNFITGFNFSVQWNATAVETVTDLGPVAIVQHSCNVTGRLDSIFGDNSYLTKFFNGTATSINIRANKSTQAVIWTFPRVTHTTEGSPTDGNNQDVNLPLGWVGSKETTYTNAMILIDRFEYFES